MIELKHFTIDGLTGGNQDWFRDPMMRLGGCAAVTACDSALYFALRFGLTEAYPFDPDQLTRKDYLRFGQIMKPYIRPRFSGVDRLEYFIDGFGQYLADRGVTRLTMEGLPGETALPEAKEALRAQLDRGFPVPCLILNHNVPEIKKEYEWHWFLLNGYRFPQEGLPEMEVRTVTYGEENWVSFDCLWNTGYERRGGLILYALADN